MALQHLDKPLSDNAGGSKNTDGMFLAQKGILWFLKQPLFGAEFQLGPCRTTVPPAFCRWKMQEDHRARTATELLYQGMGHYRHRARQTSRGVGYAPSPANRAIFGGKLPILPGKRVQHSAQAYAVSGTYNRT